jgi:hypothetical protein
MYHPKYAKIGRVPMLKRKHKRLVCTMTRVTQQHPDVHLLTMVGQVTTYQAVPTVQLNAVGSLPIILALARRRGMGFILQVNGAQT